MSILSLVTTDEEASTRGPGAWYLDPISLAERCWSTGHSCKITMDCSRMFLSYTTSCTNWQNRNPSSDHVRKAEHYFVFRRKALFWGFSRHSPPRSCVYSIG